MTESDPNAAHHVNGNLSEYYIHATGRHVRSLPIRLKDLLQGMALDAGCMVLPQDLPIGPLVFPALPRSEVV